MNNICENFENYCNEENYDKIKEYLTHHSFLANYNNGEYFEITGSGIIAEIFQHEIDHLNGILFIDNAINLKDDMPRTLEKQKKMK